MQEFKVFCCLCGEDITNHCGTLAKIGDAYYALHLNGFCDPEGYEKIKQEIERGNQKYYS